MALEVRILLSLKQPVGSDSDRGCCTSLEPQAGVDYWLRPAGADEMGASHQDLAAVTAVEPVELQILAGVQWAASGAFSLDVAEWEPQLAVWVVLSACRRDASLGEVVSALIYYCCLFCLTAVWPMAFAGCQVVAYMTLRECLKRNGV